ncbi:MAG: hypothetical protein LBH01_03325 [Verrucomicrobiales bacterium]|jgi:hypothetical protein|nr:hypothetical protein [Verrucomicrobiales bacterium]
MKGIRCGIAGLAALLLVACAQQPTVVSALGNKSAAATAHGYLLVCTPTEAVNDGNIDYYPYTGYDIYTLQGRKIAGILNHDSVHDEQPQLVVLEAGTYRIKADCGVVRTAIIKAGEVTVLDLNKPSPAKHRAAGH